LRTAKNEGAIKPLSHHIHLGDGDMVHLIAVLEDADRRIQAMKEALKAQLPEASSVFYDNAPAMIAWLETHLETVSILCLDSDLGPRTVVNRQVFDPGKGGDVVDFLTKRRPSCPVLLHSSDAISASGMDFLLKNAGWTADRVAPFGGVKWVHSHWIPSIRKYLGLENAQAKE
jgi:hypothetical protein